MDSLYSAIAMLFVMCALAILHVWCVSVLCSHRFGWFRSLLWFLPLVLLPLIGPLVFIFATRRFRADHRPSGKAQAAWFVGVMMLLMVFCGYVGVQESLKFDRSRADAAARYELKTAVAKVGEFSENARRLPGTLKEAGYEGTPAAIHVTYRQTGPMMYELSAWSDRGATTYRARSGSSEISRERRIK